MSAGFEPFDRAARRHARDRACVGVRGAVDAPLLEHAAAELAARHAMLAAPAGPWLQIGLLAPAGEGAIGMDPALGPAACWRRAGGMAVQADEDRLPFADHKLARISALMTLHGVNDLPGALILMRRALMPGGRLVAALPAGFSLGPLREALLAADAAAGHGAAVRLGPTVDPAEAAGLLQRAGFLEPVADVDTLTVRTASLARLVADIRAMGDSGWLVARARGLMTPRRWALAEAHFQAAAEPDGRVPVPVQLLYLSARAPG